jgi:uncharacterized protein YecE (DUF72 family)
MFSFSRLSHSWQVAACVELDRGVRSHAVSDEDESVERLVRVGCAGLPNGISRAAYFEHLDLLETDVTFFDPPRELALRRWHKEAPEGCAFAALAWQLVTHGPDSPGYERLNAPLSPEVLATVGGFRDTPAVREAWQRTRAAALALGAEVVLFQTPAAFAPSEANRTALRRFFETVGPETEGLTLAWEPTGLWEPAQASALANELGLVYALDPLQLEVPPPDEPRAYFRIHGLGIYRNKIADDMLEILAEMVEGYERAWVVFANVEKYRDAQRFHRLLAGREFVDAEE